ncbi:helix-turn-helix domain containing protein [Streptomyces sp. NPDC001927]
MAAELADRLQAAGFTKRDIARIIGRDASLVSQFYTQHKGAAFVPALTQVLAAVRSGVSGTEELAAVAAPHVTRRTTRSGARARVRTKTTRPAPAPELNEAAELADRLQAAGFTKRDIARIIGRDASLVSQFYTQHKGAAFVPALTQVLAAVRSGVSGTEELAAVAAPHVTRRTTRSGARARKRTKAVIITPAGTGTGRAGAQAIASGSTRLRSLIAEAARQDLRLAFTVRLVKSAYVHASGSRTDSPGIRRDVVQRADHTEERSYGSSATGGFDATEFARRTDETGGDVTAAIQQWLVETGRINVDARIIHLEIRTWRPRM